MPLGRIIHSYDDNDAALWNANFEEGLKIARATDAKEVWQGRGNQPTIHLMGGTIMGTNVGNSVVNSYGQTHEIPNLYVAGPGIFATPGASNPTYTIFALSPPPPQHKARPLPRDRAPIPRQVLRPAQRRRTWRDAFPCKAQRLSLRPISETTIHA
jgi:GMC oxidoreductase